MGDDDKFGHYLPLVRRIIILVAVLTAVPVILWTITVFVRTYVGPPKVPTFRPMAAAATMDVPATGPGLDGSVKPLPNPTVEASVTATDARSPLPTTKGPFLGDRSADGDASAPDGTVVALAATTDADAKAAPMLSGAPAMPDGAAQSAAQQPSDADKSSADALPAAQPLTGPIPLPRRRPRYFAMAQVPMPRARPEAAGPSASDAPPGPLDWLQKIFQPPQQQ